MFECRTCMLRCMRAIAGDTLPSLRPQQSGLPQSSPRFSYPASRRTQTALAVNGSSAPDIGLVPGAQPIEPLASSSASAKRAVKTELRYLTDPLKLAEHVHYTLRCEKPEKALELCRVASREGEVIVSWNHCIDWYMKQGKVNAALKIYNEMKRRAQFPDSHTYTLILRGLAVKQAESTREEKASNVVRAVSLYNSLSSPGSRVKPSIIHTNAVLTVCSEGYDLDAIWGIKAKLPQSGPNAADERTYAIFLNALRFGTFSEGAKSEVYLETTAKQRKEAVLKGRELWLELIPKWSEGDLWVDEKLVVAMARLLLWSKRLQDWDDVLSLVEQTMTIKRQLAALGSPERNTGHIPVEEEEGPTPDPEVEGEREDYQLTLISMAFNTVNPLPPPVKMKEPDRLQPLTHVRPSNLTLSLLIQACSQLRSAKAALAYWDLLTKPANEGGYDVKPKLSIIHAVIRLLSLNRSSGKMAEMIEELLHAAEEAPTGYTFRASMHVCERDNKNHGVLTHARRVIDVMMKNLPEPDIPTLHQYLSLTFAVGDKDDFLAALGLVGPIASALQKKLSQTAQEGGTRADHSLSEDTRDRAQLEAFFKKVISAIDTAMQRGFIAEENMTHWHGLRRLLTSSLTQQPRMSRRQRTEIGHESEYGKEQRSYKATESSKWFRPMTQDRRERRSHEATEGFKGYRREGQRGIVRNYESEDPRRSH